MPQEWFIDNAEDVLLVPISLVLLYIVAMLSHRLFGLRSYSKMSGTDFMTTVATGSLLGASIAAPSPSVLLAGVGLFSLLLIMRIAAVLKRRWPMAKELMENNPIFLMRGPDVLQHNLDRANVTLDELHGKLRENGVYNYGQVIAVVFEKTGDMSVIARDGQDLDPDPAIFGDVTGAQLGAR